ncbi:DUF4834 family protein [Dysgonomonas sp. BGC7]|uniref:DUF4834 family protein n=1 Tax=Dysgonomonas sp. BGC7 TaxID=1658008 RepID=UPI0006822516|nr:DUF4834 family protein [Dysgonomonas sp. BGC7]MBD8389736.1 DUF4834 family protein [Dysgonomonas sp. BGC7]
MSLIFFIIFAVMILGVMMLLSVIKGVASLIFRRPSSSYNAASGNQYRSSTSRGDSNSAGESKKVFSKNEGEYVSYEEIKD